MLTEICNFKIVSVTSHTCGFLKQMIMRKLFFSNGVFISEKVAYS